MSSANSAQTSKSMLDCILVVAILLATAFLMLANFVFIPVVILGVLPDVLFINHHNVKRMVAGYAFINGIVSTTLYSIIYYHLASDTNLFRKALNKVYG